MSKYLNSTLYGIATVGPKGQIVIPVDARKRLGVNPGDKVVIIGPENKPKIIGIASEEVFQNILKSLGGRLNNLNNSYKNQKEK